MGKKQNPHRGPSKKGMRPITLYLSEEEHTALKEEAEHAMRSKGQQARFVLRRGMGLPVDRAGFTVQFGHVTPAQSRAACKVAKQLSLVANDWKGNPTNMEFNIRTILHGAIEAGSMPEGIREPEPCDCDGHESRFNYDPFPVRVRLDGDELKIDWPAALVAYMKIADAPLPFDSGDTST